MSDPYAAKAQHSPVQQATPPGGQNFNPLDEKQAYPYRNSFEPFAFRLMTLGGIAGFYCLYFVIIMLVNFLAVSGNEDHIGIMFAAVAGMFPVVLCCAVGFYFLKPDHFVKVNRINMTLEIKKTRSGGYCTTAPPETYQLHSIDDVRSVQGSSCLACMGRSHSIHVFLRDGHSFQLTPLTDLTQGRAYGEAQKIMNAIRQCRGEPLIM